MSHTPENSALRVDAELQQALEKASFEEMKEALHTASTRQGLTVPDAINSSILLPKELAGAAPKRFGKAITVEGQKRFFEADSELEVERQIGDYFRETLAARESIPARRQQQPTEQPRDAAGRFTSDQEDLVAKADLDLRFKRGEISPAEYIEQTGAVDEYLSKQGVSMDALREATGRQFHQSWEQATQEFMQNSTGRTWPGGEENKKSPRTSLDRYGCGRVAVG